MLNEHAIPSFTESEMREKTKQALASLALEGMYPSKETMDELELMVSGKISRKEFLARCLARATKKD